MSIYICEYCFYTFKDKYTLKRHLNNKNLECYKKHNEFEEIKYDDNFEINFDKPNDILNSEISELEIKSLNENKIVNLQKNHNNKIITISKKNIYNCLYCDKSYNTNRSLNRHMKEKH